VYSKLVAFVIGHNIRYVHFSGPRNHKRDELDGGG